jgi:hypothetical protein
LALALLGLGGDRRPAKDASTRGLVDRSGQLRELRAREVTPLPDQVFNAVFGPQLPLEDEDVLALLCAQPPAANREADELEVTLLEHG